MHVLCSVLQKEINLLKLLFGIANIKYWTCCLSVVLKYIIFK